MNRKILPLAGLLMFCCVSIHAAELPPQFMGEDELRIGMKGYGLTSFHPGTIEKFEFTLIGVHKNKLGPDLDMILIDIDHPLLVDIGIVAGMSGSPVFVEDRMIGALGYGWAGSKRAIGGVTPIRKMLEVQGYASAAGENGSSTDGNLNQAPEPTPHAYRFEPKLLPWESAPEFRNSSIKIGRSALPESLRDAAATAPQIAEFVPLATPVMAGDIPGSIFPVIHKTLAAMGLSAVRTGSLSSQTDIAASPGDLAGIVAGAPLGIEFVGGDLALGGLGTVTWRDGDTLIAFGHPLTQAGRVSLPMTACTIFSILPSVDMSFKLGTLTKHVGTLTKDYAPAVSGVLGAAPRMIPMNGRLVQLERMIDHPLHMRVVDAKVFTPRMAFTAITNSIATIDQETGPSTTQLNYQIHLQDGTQVEKHLLLAGEGVAPLLGAQLFRDLYNIMENPFRQIDIDKIDFDIRAQNDMRQTTILSAQPMREVYKPGEPMTIKLKLVEYKGREYSRTVQLTAPQTVIDQEYLVTLLDADTQYNFALLKKPFGLSPANWDELLELIQLDFPANRIYLTILESRPGLAVEGREFNGLPPSLHHALEGAAAESMPSRLPFSEVAAQTVEIEGQFSGAAFFKFQVTQKGK